MFTTPLLRGLRRAYPRARLTYLVEADAAPVVRFNPHLDEVIVAARTRGLRRIADDVAQAPRAAWLTWASGARERIGYAISGRRWMYTRLAPRAPDLRPRHSVANQWDLLAAIPGWPGGDADPEHDAVEMPLQPDADARMAARLAAAGVDDGDELVVLHVSAGNLFRRWPEPFFAETAAAWPPATRRRVVLSSGPSDRAATARIAAGARQRMNASGGRIVDLGEFDLQELRALIGRSRVFVGGDTGPLHMAAATTTPVVGIYGPTLSAQSAPWRPRAIPTYSIELTDLACRPCDQRACVPGDFRCLTRLGPADVIAAAERALASPRLKTGPTADPGESDAGIGESDADRGESEAEMGDRDAAGRVFRPGEPK
jgi:ADP-heptose:LPS heptosyltransferase